jgi:hypothetical protein
MGEGFQSPLPRREGLGEDGFEAKFNSAYHNFIGYHRPARHKTFISSRTTFSRFSGIFLEQAFKETA